MAMHPVYFLYFIFFYGYLCFVGDSLVSFISAILDFDPGNMLLFSAISLRLLLILRLWSVFVIIVRQPCSHKNGKPSNHVYANMFVIQMIFGPYIRFSRQGNLMRFVRSEYIENYSEAFRILWENNLEKEKKRRLVCERNSLKHKNIVIVISNKLLIKPL